MLTTVSYTWMDEPYREIGWNKNWNKYLRKKKKNEKKRGGVWGSSNLHTQEKHVRVSLQPRWQFRHGKITEGRSSLLEQEKDVPNNCVICHQISRDKNRLICSKVAGVTEWGRNRRKRDWYQGLKITAVQRGGGNKLALFLKPWWKKMVPC